MIRGDIKMYNDDKELDFRPIGKAIKKARENKGWTQEKLGQLIDRDVRTVMYFENRGHHPRLEVFYKLLTNFFIQIVKIQKVICESK